MINFFKEHDSTWSEASVDGTKKTTTVRKYKLPFFNYETTVTKNSETGDKRVERTFTMCDDADLKKSALITLCTAVGFSGICKGISAIISSSKGGKR